MRGTAWVVALVLLVGGCAAITPRDNSPVAVWTSQTSLDATASCIVNELNLAMKSPSTLLRPDLTHKIEITSPNQTYEIGPQQTVVVAGEVYFVRLHRAAASATQIELYAVGAWSEMLKPPVEKCVKF